MYVLDDERYDDADFYDEVHKNDAEPDVGENADQDTSEVSSAATTKRPKDEEPMNDWDRYGLNQTYEDKEFDETKALTLLYKEDPKSKREAIKYVTYFAKRNCNEAKMFLVTFIQDVNKELYGPEYKDVFELAKNALWLTMRNYVRIVCENYYKKQSISDAERYERVVEALNQCAVYIFENIDRYDPSTGYQLTTFFNAKVLTGAIFEFESDRTGESSKQDMRTNKLVVNAMKDCEDRGIAPTTALIAQMTGKSVREVTEALARVHAKNTMTTIDVPDFNNKGGLTAQTSFEMPEASLLDQERRNDMMQHLGELNDEERTLLCLNLGFECDGNQLIEKTPLKAYEIEQMTGIDRIKVQQIIAGALQKLKKSYNVREKRGDALLSGRGLVFEQDDTDDLDDIIAIY